MIQSVSESVIVPIAGIFFTIIACYEFIQMIIDHNNLANFETWIFFKWVFKTFVAVMLITNCFNIAMAVFDVAQNVINSASGLIGTSTSIDGTTLASMQTTLEAMEMSESTIAMLVWWNSGDQTINVFCTGQAVQKHRYFRHGGNIPRKGDYFLPRST